MAEIRIERKKSGIPIWAVLLVLIVLAALVWFFMSRRSQPTNDTVNNTAMVIELSAPSPALSFMPATRCA